jgi:hypothetical protein
MNNRSHERTRAVLDTRKFLYDLISPERTPDVPVSIRRAAESLLEDYPGSVDITIAALGVANWFTPPRKLRK